MGRPRLSAPTVDHCLRTGHATRTSTPPPTTSLARRPTGAKIVSLRLPIERLLPTRLSRRALARYTGAMSASAEHPTFAELADLGATIGAALIARGERVGVAESSSGGLISAALLSVPGASAYYLGGSVIYTGRARGLLFERDELPADLRGASEPYAERLALGAAAKLRAEWGLSETGATGPTGNPYGDPPGHSWVAVARPDGSTVTRIVSTGDDDRPANMYRFSAVALQLLAEELG